MGVTRVTCTHCGRTGSTTRELRRGAKMRCPACGRVSAYEEPADAGYALTEIEPAPAPPSRPVEALPPCPQHPVAPPTARVVGETVTHTGPVVHAVQVVVPEARKGNALAITSLVLGVIAALMCWVPFLGLLSWPVGGLAALLGVPAFVLAVVAKRSGVAASVVGSGLGLGAIVFSFIVTDVTARSVSKALKEKPPVVARAAPAAAPAPAAQPPQVPAAPAVALTPPAQPPQGQAPPAGAVAPAPQPGGVAGDGRQTGAKAARNDQEWVVAPTPAALGDVKVEVHYATVCEVPLKTFRGETTSQNPQLVIVVVVTNSSATRKVDYRTWAGPEFTIDYDDFARLTDNFGNTYKRVRFSDTPVGRVEADSVYPGKWLPDVLVFEPPLGNAEYLNLELPGKNVGVDGVYRFRIPTSMIRKAPPGGGTATPIPSGPSAPTNPPPPRRRR